MLIDTEMTIKVTNDGATNTTTLTYTESSSFAEILTVLELVKQSVEKDIEQYIVNNYGTVTEKKFKEIMYSRERRIQV